MDYILKGLIEGLLLLINGDEETYSAIKITLYASSVSILITLIIGFPLGFILGFYEFRLKKALRLISDTALSMPTVAVGLIIYAFISSQGPLGGLGLLFTIKALIIGQTALALPIVISLSASVIDNMNKKHYQTILSYHLTPLNQILTVLFELRYALIVVIATAYGRIIAEVGVAMIVGGNIKWFTRTITTAISLETNKGEFATGIALALVLIMIAFTVNFSIHCLKKLDK